MDPSILKAVDPNKKFRSARNREYPLQLWYFVSASLFVLLLLHAVSRARFFLALRRQKASNLIRTKSSNPSAQHDDVERQTRTPRSVNLISKTCIIALSLTKIVAFRLSVSLGFGPSLSLVEFLACAAYLSALLTWNFINTRDVVTGQNLTIGYWSNRSGILAVSQVSFVVALAGKNNLISLLTGISYEKLNLLHRSAARSLLILIYIHVYARSKIGLTRLLSSDWLRAGIVATAGLSILVLFGNRYTRSRLYEAFLFVHHFMALIFLVCLIPHVADGGYQKYAWPALLLWGLDRLIRVARVIYSRILQRRSSIPTKAAIEMLSSNTLRITITLRRSKLLAWRAGQHAYLCIPAVSSFWHPWEFHPFTMANIMDNISHPSVSSIGKRRASNDDDVEMKFIIRARDGFTGRLLCHIRDRTGAKDPSVHANETTDNQSFVSAYVDGPYGTPPHVAAYQTIVCIAGGSGVTYTLPLLMDAIRRASADPFGHLCRRVVFVWYIRHFGDLEWIAKDLRDALANVTLALKVEVRIFVTGARVLAESSLPSKETADNLNDTVVPDVEREGNVSAEKEVEDDRTSESENTTSLKTNGEDVDALLGNSFFSLSFGRAAVGDILLDESMRCEGESMLVVVSGPRSLTASVRKALCKSSIAGLGAASRGTNVTLHVEGFEVA